MAKRETSSLPQPPWVWGTKEVEDWLRASSPSRPRKGRQREGPETIARLDVEVADGDRPGLRDAIERVCEQVGLGIVWAGEESPSPVPRHRADVALRRSLIGTEVRIGIRFDPPIHPSSAARIVRVLTKRFAVTKVSVKARKVRLPPRDR